MYLQLARSDEMATEAPSARERSAGRVAPIITGQSLPAAAPSIRGAFTVYAEQFRLVTEEEPPAFHDLTEQAQQVVSRSTITAGTILVSSRHTTCAVVVQESEPLLLMDMADRLRRFAGDHETYRHNNFEIRTVNMCDGECANGHAHCQHLLLGASVTLPVVEGRILLGLWQRIFLVELDRPRLRHYSMQVMGVTGEDR